MDELLSEKEQIEAIRAWWRENGRYVISGLVIGVGLLFGWNYWNSQQRESQLDASALYESLLADVAEPDVTSAEETANRLYTDYASTIYAQQARLAMSRLYMDLGRDEDAAGQLRQLLGAGSDAQIALVARLRLAKILLYQDKPEEVVELLQGYRDTSFGARYSEALGDAYVALGRIEDAADAYTAALADNPNTPTVDRTLIQLKIYDLPDVPASDAMEADTVDGEGVAGSDAVRDKVPLGDAPAERTPPEESPTQESPAGNEPDEDRE